MSAEDSFDYIVVGAGSAGAALASRLSEDASLSVCLIEAGPKDRSPFIKVPLGVMWLAKDAKHNWLFSSAPQKGLDGRSVSIPRGKVLGGSSAINGMIYIRGHRTDYDDWAALGCEGWDYDSVLPYFKRSEANQDAGKDDAFHGRTGPLSVANLRDPNPLDHDFIEAAGRLQFRATDDFNAPDCEGVGIYQVTQKDGARHSSSAAYLTPIRSRANLHIVTDAEVTRVNIEDHRATGVTLRDPSGTRTITARFDVILSAGAIGSPDLLLRSGIGPGAALQALGQDVVTDLPGVGQNLQDHVDVMVICKSRSATPWGISLRALPARAGDLLNWIARQRGMFSSNMVEAGGFVRSSPTESRPDLQFHMIPGRKSHRGRMIEWGHGISLHTCVLRPKSRGSVNRTHPDGPPVIDLGLLTHDDDLDRLMKGVRLARNIIAQDPLSKHGLSEIVPGNDVQDDEGLASFIRANARTVYHPVGTCAMGTDDMAVTDPRLRVRGVMGLRVVDASIMPRLVSGNTNAPAIMIAEKAADMIADDAKSGTRHR